jgi:TetR/AcrR family transcriptional repressor of bet genes
MGPIRRRQLIDATIASIGEHGLAGTTLSRVSRRAGLSSGIVAHYFEDKAGLLEAAMRSLCGELRRQVAEGLSRAATPRERLLAVIDATLAPEQFAHEVVGVWLSFWAQLGQQPELARVQRVYERRLRSNLLQALRQLAPSDVAEQLATGLSALIDGLWLRSALGGAAVAPRDARRIGRDYITNGLERLAGGRAEPT